jgi:hypothetical protein
VRFLHVSSDRLCEERESLDRFADLRAAIYRDDYYYYPEQDTERRLLLHYARRPDYRFELIVGDDGAGRDVARVLVGRCDAFPFGFFGFFECPEDAGAFTELMHEAARVARGLGASDLLGPIDLNGLHNWQFLTYSEDPERWVGDPYHRAYYPSLFARAGWEVSDESTSGVIDRRLQRALLTTLPAALRDVKAAGLDVRWREEVSLEELLPKAWRLSMSVFTPDANRMISVAFDVFKAQVEPVLAAFDDHMSTLCLFRGDELVGFALTYTNFIHRLCNPDGRKRLPHIEPPALVIAPKTVAVSPSYRGGAPWKAMFLLLMEQSLTRFEGRGGWRRSNVKNPSIKKFSAVGRVTHRYAAFRRGI